MRVVKVFFLGFLYGWFMKLILDEIYTKDHLRMITNENALLKERLQLLEAAPILHTQPQPVADIRRTMPRGVPVARSRPTLTASRKDDLKLIKGIGPKMEKKLNTAGVMTFEQMSQLTTTDIQNILGLSKRVVQSSDNLVTQAKKLAQKKTKQ